MQKEEVLCAPDILQGVLQGCLGFSGGSQEFATGSLGVLEGSQVVSRGVVGV